MRPRRALSFVIAGLGLGAAAMASAGAPVGSWYLSAEALDVVPDSHFNADVDVGFRIAFGRVLSEQWDAELGWAHSRFGAADTNPAGELRLDVGELAVARVFRRSEAINPFIEPAVGFESGRYDNGRSASDPTGKVGIGLLADLVSLRTSSLQLRADAGGRVDTAAGNGTRLDPYIGLGVRWNFGAPALAPALAPPAPPPPAPPPPVAQALMPLPVPAAPLPPPPPPMASSLTIRLQVYFDNDSAQIKPESDPDLDRLVSFLKQSTGATGVLEGHTDNTGKPAHNLALSKRRADAVKAYLVAHGIDGARLSTMGYGQTRPIADNGTAEGRARNRRVVFQRTDVQP